MEKDRNIATKPKKPTKWLASITYAIVVVCLLLGLLLPLSNVAGTGTENMLIMQLPGAAGSLFGIADWSTVGSLYTYGYGVNFLGLLSAPFDLGSVFVLLYALVTLAALIGLIPVLASKKTSRTAIKTASVIEVCAITVLSVLMFMQLLMFCDVEAIQFSYSLLVAFGGTLVCLIIQAFADKKGSGAIKFVSLLLSGIAVFFIIYPVVAYIPQTSSLEFFVNGLYSGAAEGLDYAGAGGGILSLMTLFSSAFALAGSAAVQTVTVITLITALLVIANFLLDAMGLGKKTNKFMLVANLIRYSLESAAVIIMFVVTFFIEGVSAGILLYVLLAIAILQLIISVVRFLLAKSKKPAAATVAHPAQQRESSGAASAPVADSYEARRAERRAQREADLARRAVVEERAERRAQRETDLAQRAVEEEKVQEEPAPVVQEVLYDGPVDDFIRKLNNMERKEFYAVFLERSRGNLTNVPDYIVGGNNSKFFSSVFIYYGRVRPLVSDGLLNKLYEQAHVM